MRIRTIDNSFVREGDFSGLRVSEVLRRLGLSTEEYVVAKNGVIVAEDEVVEDGDEITLYPVVSGG